MGTEIKVSGDLTFDQGATAVWHFDVYTDKTKTTLADLTGYSARGVGREATGTILDNPVIFEIVLSVSGSRVTCSIPPAISSAVLVFSGVYDVELYNPLDVENIHRIASGTWTMLPEVTL